MSTATGNIATGDRRVLCVLPGIPERRTGGGMLLFEVLAYLATQARIAAVVPVAAHLRSDYEETCHDPLLAGITWRPLTEFRVPGVRGAICRLCSRLPSDVSKYAVGYNRKILACARADWRPDVELVISSPAAAPYPALRLPSHARLYMVNVDPEIIRYDGPSLKRRVAATADRLKMEWLCRRALRSAGNVGAISAADVTTLNRMGRRTDVTFVPPLMRPQPLDRTNVVPHSVLITTNFTYTQNVTSLEWFFRECWPHVDPRAQLTVTGKDEGDRLALLCRAQPRVYYAGCLGPAEFDFAFARAAVAVNPTRHGSGFQIKLLDALARGVPIVSTAFSNQVGPAIASSDDPAELAALINARLQPAETPPFDYERYYQQATVGWDTFLFGSPQHNRTERDSSS
jgi:hypothetical protein